MPRQTNFGGGEISPLLWGRTDLPFWPRSLRACLNFFISKPGAAVSRPGTTLVGEAENSPLPDIEGLPAHADKPILIPFNAADDESFCLVFGPGYVQFVTKGGFVESDPGVRYSVVTPYAYSDLRKLRYAQVGEVLTLVCPNWDAYELRHLGDAPPSWSFERAVTAPPEPWYRDIDAPTGHERTTGFSLCNGSGTAPDAHPLPTQDADHPEREWQWKVTALMRDNATGELFETLPELVIESFSTPLNDDPNADGDDYDTTHANLTKDTWALYPDQPITLRRAHSLFFPTTPDGFDESTIVAYNIYRGRGGLFGFVGQTTSREFVDVGDEPNYAEQPPQGTNPFSNATEATAATAPLVSDEDVAAGVVVRRADRASAVAYFEQRRVFGGLTRKEQTLAISSNSDFDNFDERKLFHVSGESLIVGLAARRRGRIRHLVPMSRLVILTASASFHGGGSAQGAPLDFDDMWFPQIEEVGAADVVPLLVDGACLFIPSMGRGARALVAGDGGFQGVDISEFAEHLFRGAEFDVVDWTFAKNPWGLIWAVRSDGTLLSLTLSKQQDMVAWARHEMTHLDDDDNTVIDGQVEAVCAVPEGDEDAVYLVVKRTIQGVEHRYLERMTSRHERGGAELIADDGLARALDLTQETPPDFICLDSAISYVGPAVTTFTGLDHLEGKDVYVLAEGHAVYGPFTVAGGEITLPGELEALTEGPTGTRLVAHVGLLYRPELELLDVIGSDARARMKQVTHVCLEVDRSKGLQVGQDFEHMDEIPPRDVSDSYQAVPVRTQVVEVNVSGTWDINARMVVRQTQPLPATIVGISRKVVGGDN